jgi:hypothetical protein
MRESRVDCTVHTCNVIQGVLGRSKQGGIGLLPCLVLPCVLHFDPRRRGGRCFDGRKGSFGRRLTLKRRPREPRGGRDRDSRGFEGKPALVRKQGLAVKAHKAVKCLDALLADCDADLWPAAAVCLEEVSKSARGYQGAGGDSPLATVRSCSLSFSACWVSCQKSPALSAESKFSIRATNDSL